jgi:hypothetical protein
MRKKKEKKIEKVKVPPLHHLDQCNGQVGQKESRGKGNKYNGHNQLKFGKWRSEKIVGMKSHDPQKYKQ